MSEERNANLTLNMTPEEAHSLVNAAKITFGFAFVNHVPNDSANVEPTSAADISAMHAAERLMVALEGASFHEATNLEEHRRDTIEAAVPRFARYEKEAMDEASHDHFIRQAPRWTAEIVNNSKKARTWIFTRKVNGADLLSILDRFSGDPERAELVEFLPATEAEIMQWRRSAGEADDEDEDRS